MIMAALWAPQIEQFTSLFRYLQQVLAYTIPPVVVLFFASIFSARANVTGAKACLISGTVAGAAMFLLNVTFGLVDIHFLYVVPIGCAVSWIALEVGTRMGGEPVVSNTRWTPEFFHDETEALKGVPWFRNYRVWSVMLLIATGVLVWIFR